MHIHRTARAAARPAYQHAGEIAEVLLKDRERSKDGLPLTE
jgi:hypothetical protein